MDGEELNVEPILFAPDSKGDKQGFINRVKESLKEFVSGILSARQEEKDDITLDYKDFPG